VFDRILLLLLLMLEAVHTDLFHHQPEAQHPKIFSYPQAGPPITPSVLRTLLAVSFVAAPGADVGGQSNSGIEPISSFWEFWIDVH
jgi:hypothetical protein